MKNKPRKLTLTEIWEVYNLLSDALPDDLSVSLLDSVEWILDSLESVDILMQVLSVFYSKPVSDKLSGLDVLDMLTVGLKENDFFLFVEFVRSTKDA